MSQFVTLTHFNTQTTLCFVCVTKALKDFIPVSLMIYFRLFKILTVVEACVSATD